MSNIDVVLWSVGVILLVLYLSLMGAKAHEQYARLDRLEATVISIRATTTALR